MAEKAEKKEECVQVVVRCRPFNRKETEEKRENCVSMDLEGNAISLRNPEEEHLQPKPFTFDAVYDENTIQKNFYEESCSALVENVLEGFNGTIFAYGQTGCGKTWTMQGPPNPPELRGVIPNSFTHIFDFVKASTGVEFLVRCSYLEIYNEVVRDLLVDPKHATKCDIKEDPDRGVFVSNLTDVVVEKEEEMDAVLSRGLHHRTVGATAMNAESSRSHAIFTVIIEMNTKDDSTGKDHIRAGKLNLVDLAGSERQKKTGATGDRLKEGSKINLSLSALGNVISALSEGNAKHIPYRDSKLTRMLQDSLGGNTKTLMVAAISPADYNYDETLSTLRYANRAKNIKNKPKINEDPKDTMLREYKAEIENLRKMLADQAAVLSGDPAALAAMMQMQNQFAAAHPTVAQVSHNAKPPHANANASEEEEDEDGGVDFASLGAVSKSAKKAKSPRAPASGSPSEGEGEQEVDKRSPRVVERVVEVVVERVPADQASKQRALEEHSQAVERERDMYGEQLRAAEEAAEAERAARLELTQRLEDMQRKLMGRSESIADMSESGGGGGGSPTAVAVTAAGGGGTGPPAAVIAAAVVAVDQSGGEMGSLSDYNFATEPASGSDGFPAVAEQGPRPVPVPAVAPGVVGPGMLGQGAQMVVETEAVAKEREAALVRIRERKRKAKKKADNKLRAERERALKESNDFREELDDLREAAGDKEADREATDKKLVRLRKKFERREAALEQDKAELSEQFTIERDNLLDTVREQQQDIKLYEQICRSLLSNKKMNQILDKARWSEEDDQWSLPFFKGDKDGGFSDSPDTANGSALPGISPKAPVSGAPGIAFPRNVSSEAKNYGGGNGTSLPPAFGKKQVQKVSKSGDEDDAYADEKKSKKLQLPEFSQRTTLPSAATVPVPVSARSEVNSSRDGTPAEGEKKKKKKKKEEKPYDECKAKQALSAALVCVWRSLICGI
jgi:hypothetical protein